MREREKERVGRVQRAVYNILAATRGDREREIGEIVLEIGGMVERQRGSDKRAGLRVFTNVFGHFDEKCVQVRLELYPLRIGDSFLSVWRNYVLCWNIDFLRLG